MRILLTGSTGYIGQRLIPILINAGHDVVCLTRDKTRFNAPSSAMDHIQVVEADLLDEESLNSIPENIDAAYYLVHSMSGSKEYSELEERSARNFVDIANKRQIKQVIYLSGMVNENTLSKHLRSRKNVEDKLGEGNFALTTLRAGIIIGSGSASFEIIRDLVEKLPVMVAPKWLNTRCQPIGISDVLQFLNGVLMKKECFDKNFDIGGPDVLTYREMLYGYASARGLKRSIVSVPVMTPRLSSYWLYFVTSTSYKLATALVDSMKVEVVARNNDLAEIIGIRPISYMDALKRALSKIKNDEIISSWKDAMISGTMKLKLSDYIDVPVHGCLKDKRIKSFSDKELTVSRLWKIGGQTGWYYANFLWRIRGFLDKLVGGVGLRRGRTHKDKLETGDAVDFWRVLYANRSEGRLLLFAEMKLPGEAWLEFQVKGNRLIQTATFRPKGLGGRLYWYAVLPFHGIVFKGMLNRLTE